MKLIPKILNMTEKRKSKKNTKEIIYDNISVYECLECWECVDEWDNFCKWCGNPLVF